MLRSDDGQESYFIDPDERIDCGACVSGCPVEAIYHEEDVPAQWHRCIGLDAAYFLSK